MRAPSAAEIELARSLYPRADWAGSHVEEGGSEHLVLVAAPVAVLRIARTDRAARDLPRRVAVVDALASRLPFELPVPLSGVAQHGTMTAVVQRFIPGSPHPFGSGDPHRLRALLRKLAEVDGELTGVLDRDRAATWDPAINLAHLSMWHGADLLDQIAADPETARRATVWVAAQSLERVDHLATRTDRPDRNRLLRTIEPRLRRAEAVFGRAGH